MISNYYILMLLIFVLGLAVYFTGLFFQKIEPLNLMANSISLFFSAYIIFSGIFFWIDRFKFEDVLLLEGICFAIAIAVLVIKERRITFEIQTKRRNILKYAIILVGLFISLPKFTFYGMGQDEGVYQTKAIALAYGYTERQFDFKEYQFLETDDQREEYNVQLTELLGFYPYDTNGPTVSPDEKISPTSGIFHGIPTFPAVLGLFAKIFNVSTMQHVQSIFFLCSMLFVLFIVENLGLNNTSQCLSLVVVALSPIIQWVIKSALTEGFLVLVFAWFIYLITNSQYKRLIMYSAIPIWTFAFWHVSIFTLIPLFVCIYIISYEETKNHTYIFSCISILVFFVVGSAMMMYVSPRYTGDNIRYGFRFLDNTEIVSTYLLVCVVGTVFLLLIDRIKFDVIYNWLKREKVFSIIIRITFFICFIAIGTFALDILNGRHVSPHYESGIGGISHLSILAFVFGTGLVSLPICILIIWELPSKMLCKKNNLILTTMFFYCVILMSAFIRKEVAISYYYSRYLAPFIVICAITIGIVLDVLPQKINLAITCCSIAFFLPYNWWLLTEKDDSRLDWNVLQDISNVIAEHSAVVFDKTSVFDQHGIGRILMIPIKTMCHADVYPLFMDSESEMDFLLSRYEDIYVVTTDLFKIANASPSENYLYIKEYDAHEDRGKNKGLLTRFPLGSSSQTVTIGVLKYGEIQLEYDFSGDDILCNGFGDVESDSFRWTSGNVGTMIAFLDKKNYYMDIIQGPKIPVENLDRELIINISVNGQEVQPICFSKTYNPDDIQIIIPKQYLRRGKNIISFSGETWSPVDFGKSDSRQMLFSVSKIEFTELSDDDMQNYDFGEREFFNFAGFSGNEGTYRWTSDSPAEIEVFTLESGYDYQCTVVFGPGAIVESQDTKGHIVINGREEYGVEFDIQSSGQAEFTFDIDQSLLTGETDTFQIYSPLWSPADHGSSDTRTLGVSIDKIIFEKQE